MQWSSWHSCVCVGERILGWQMVYMGGVRFYFVLIIIDNFLIERFPALCTSLMLYDKKNIKFYQQLLYKITNRIKYRYMVSLPCMSCLHVLHILARFCTNVHVHTLKIILTSSLDEEEVLYVLYVYVFFI